MKTAKIRTELIWVWDMTSKRVIILFAGLLLCSMGLADSLSEKFIETVFGAVPDTKRLELKGDAEESVRLAYGGRYPLRSIPYWQTEAMRVWVLRAKGKFGFIYAGFVVEDGRLVQCRVLSSKEQMGKVVETDRFLRQFKGAGLDRGGKMDRRVDGYSGATMSVNAIKKMARLALTLDVLAGAAPE